MKILRYFILTLAVIICGNGFAQKKSQQELHQLMQQRNEYYFTFNLNGQDDLRAIAQAISVDHVEGQVVTAYANNEDFAKFQKLGYEVTLQTPPSMLEEVSMWDGSNRAEYDWDSYPTYEAYEAMMFQFATDHPDKCEIITLGTLPSNRKILIAHLNNGTADGKPKFLYSSTIHGDETTGWIMMLRLIDYILENPSLPECQTVLDNIDLYIAPLANPDGTYHAGNNNVNGATRDNANGVDMNRNYPDPHSGPHPDNKEYQTETQWFMQLAQDVPFVMAANYHGGAEVLNYPWDNTYTLTADDAWWQLVCHEYADLCHTHNPSYMNMQHEYADNGIINGARWYMIGGGRQDYTNGYAQCREVTIECSNTKLPNANQLPTFWTYNKEGLFAYMSQCLYGIHGTVTDKDTGEPLEASVTIANHDDEYSIVESHLPAGDYHRPIKAGTYDVTFSCRGYHPQTVTITVTDGQTVTQNIQLENDGTLEPDFNANRTNLSPGESINFSDNTWGAYLVSWEWTFEGGEPASSSEQNPSGITYSQIGTYDVTLTVTNRNGQSETITKQNYITVSESYIMQNGTVTTCDAMFYDDGGPEGNYRDRKNYTMTFMPTGSGRKISAEFLSFDTEAQFDFLYIYDGTSTSAPQIGRYDGNNSPGTIVATNEEGALTFRFTSDDGVNAAGWATHINCISDNPITIEVSATPNVVFEGESCQLNVVATGGSGEYTYLWEPADPINEGTLDDPTIANPIATPMLAPESVYKITVTDSEGIVASDVVVITVKPNSVPENGRMLYFYPNPNNGSFTVNINGKFSYRLINALGQQVMSGEGDGKTLIDASSLNQGVYFLQITTDVTRVEKLIIEK